MPRTKGATNKKLKLYKGVGKALRAFKKGGRSLNFNPRPIFTETFRASTNPGDPLAPLIMLNSNTGNVLSCRISQIPQIDQYRALYTKYRILGVKFICLPSFNSTSADANSANYNNSVAVNNYGMGRIVTSVQNSPLVTVPVDENDVLEDNGCKIHIGKSKLVLSCRPVPDLLDANNVAMTQKNKFINFNMAGPDATHYGIRYWYSLPTAGPLPAPNQPYHVYFKLTFQLSDPR